MLRPEPAEIARRLLARDRSAVGPALNLTDDRRPERRTAALELVDLLERQTPFPGAHRVGLTGAPGAGKSTLLDALVRALRRRGETLGIVAVDPSSRRSGGALLGDRIRVRSGAADPAVFIRSMASRSRLGGLADATRAAVVILAAAFDRVFVETVGVGQSEAEVAELVDSLVYIANPGTGDTLQFLKAGLLELPDLFVVNKADLGAAAERAASELGSAIGLTEHAERPVLPVLLTSARDETGIEQLVGALDEHRERLLASGELRARRLRSREAHVLDSLERRYGSYGLAAGGGPEALRQRVAADPAASASGLVAALGREIEEALRKG